ncbi:MAG TPA: hypothetical protein VK985_14990 [Rariglobus sp.]|nr:hypothetical protein [Rariglobus sp.]
MAYLERHLTPWLAMTVALLSSSLIKAQPEPEPPPVTFRTLALGLGSLADVFYDVAPGRPVSISATNSSFSAPYVAPKSGLVSIYRLVPPVPPETKPQRLPVAEARVGKGGPWLVLMVPSSENPGQVGARVVDDSWEVHPVTTMRIFNFSKRKAGIKIDESTFELPSGESQIVKYPPNSDQVWVRAAMMDEHGWVIRVSGPQATIPKTRSTMILADGRPERDNPDTRGVTTSNLVDVAPPAILAQLEGR